jgi:hypothetical protein
MRRLAPVVAVIGIMIVLAGCSSDPTTSEEYLTLETAKAEAATEAEKAATQGGDEAEAALAEADAEIAILNDAWDEAKLAKGIYENGFEDLADAAEHLLAWELWLEPEFIDELEGVGANLAAADQIMTDRDWSDDWREYGDRDGYSAILLTRLQVDDEALGELWNTWLDTPLESDDEVAASWDYSIALWAYVFDKIDAVRASRLTQSS